MKQKIDRLLSECLFLDKINQQRGGKDKKKDTEYMLICQKRMQHMLKFSFQECTCAHPAQIRSFTKDLVSRRGGV